MVYDNVGRNCILYGRKYIQFFEFVVLLHCINMIIAGLFYVRGQDEKFSAQPTWNTGQAAVG